MRPKTWTALAAAIFLSIGALAQANAAPSILVANVYSAPPGGSDANMRWGAARVERDIDELQSDQHDYDGHRVRAIRDMQGARYQIGLGVAYDKGSESEIEALKAQMNAVASEFSGENGSDRNLAYVKRDLDQVIDTLSQDNHDYGGHRVNAIGDLQQARAQLQAALSSDNGSGR